ncbi:hypothetical protein A2767_04455 [Candidatus Roizmanbacteria bacterium RIFCSPHIGHO2_01_FULL_35_10]|uniref:Uncharacterized protein n=1 Tax=Candidatus Roizmanbacteria bacterium RIFCSPLOWO2_01_FULL_35_13 TaxID=1802055 RepID=A0A1F7I6N7_9BACT|nr:MAG: hypothetical protein A2767_04455 [Candidatus Roizmanbacteria bacterium RIFCSPHIGHO2_01_FULL_35_10]OGK39034.1 MAG: hypothetical protein A3A74_04570 [Candidatus Roizmanbacteria bacterium RIFCSPLOWO2_01_FULL_35_13]
MSLKKPKKIFQYPGSKENPNGSRMCADGLVRSAEYGRQLLNEESTLKSFQNSVVFESRAL